MRVLHVGKFFPPHAGGIERFSAELIEALAAQGVEQAALVHGSPGERRPRPARSAAQPIEAAPTWAQLLFVPLAPSVPLRLRRLLRRFRPDLLHVHAPNPSAFWLLASPAARRLPWILHWHADVPADARHPGVRAAYPLYRGLERRLLARSAAVIATSGRYRDASVALAPFRQRSCVIPLGLADRGREAGAAVRWPGSGLRVLAVGRLSYYKGFAHLLDAVAKVPEAGLLLVGAGEQRGALEQRIGRLGIGDRVRLAGPLDDAALEAAYRDCDVLCLPSVDRAEAFGLVLLEAMRAGKPTVASAIAGSGVTSVVEHEVTGLHAAPEDPAALAAALSRLARDPALRERLGAAGRERFESRFRIDRVASEIHDLYRRVLAETAAGPAAPP